MSVPVNEMARARLLVSGSHGFIGQELCTSLNAHGVRFDRLERTPPLWPDGLADRLDLSPYSAVVHLATPRIRDRDSWEQVERDTLVPLQGLLSAIRRTNPAGTLVFVSSQAATPRTPSVYGRVKWQSEQMIAASGCRFVVIRPGLVVGPGNRGVFAALLRLIRRSPVIPLVGRGDQMLQLVALSALVGAIERISTAVDEHDRGVYCLGIEPVSLRELLLRAAEMMGVRRSFVPVPTALVELALAGIELVLPSPPLTRVSLRGLLSTPCMDTAPSLARLGVVLPDLTATLSEALGRKP